MVTVQAARTGPAQLPGLGVPPLCGRARRRGARGGGRLCAGLHQHQFLELLGLARACACLSVSLGTAGLTLIKSAAMLSHAKGLGSAHSSSQPSMHMQWCWRKGKSAVRCTSLLGGAPVRRLH